VEGGIDNLEGANVLVGGDLVGEGSVDDDAVDVVVGGGGEGNLSEFGVLVELALGFGCRLGGSGGFLSGAGSWHCKFNLVV